MIKELIPVFNLWFSRHMQSQYLYNSLSTAVHLLRTLQSRRPNFSKGCSNIYTSLNAKVSILSSPVDLTRSFLITGSLCVREMVSLHWLQLEAKWKMEWCICWRDCSLCWINWQPYCWGLWRKTVLINTYCELNTLTNGNWWLQPWRNLNRHTPAFPFLKYLTFNYLLASPAERLPCCQVVPVAGEGSGLTGQIMEKMTYDG